MKLNSLVLAIIFISYQRIGLSLPGSCQNLNTNAKGEFGTTEYKLHFEDEDGVISPWHDIPLVANSADGTYNFIVEIPKYTTAKMEVNKENPHNPIMQDISKGKPRYHKYGITFFNYGLLPQTWEDPGVKDSEGNGGDNDPLDVMEVGSQPLKMGSVVPVKVLGCLELIDEGETDHKIIVINTEDPYADDIDDMQSLESVHPGITNALVTWLKLYKTADGKGENRLRQDEPTSKAEAISIINHTNQRWKALMKGEVTETGFFLRKRSE